MDDNELNRLFDMTGDEEEGEGKEQPAKKPGFFERLKNRKKNKKSPSKGILDDVLDFDSDEAVSDEGQEPEEVSEAEVSSDEVTSEAEKSEEAEPADTEPKEDDEASEPESGEQKTEGESDASSEEDKETEEDTGSDESEPEEGDSEDEGGEEAAGEDQEPEESGEAPKAKAARHKPKYRLKTPDVELPKPSRKLILAAILVVLVVTVTLCIALLPAFRVKYMKIDGNAVVSDQEILEATKLKYNAHLFAGISGNILDILKLNYGKTEEKIKRENPYIRDIEISVSLPSTVHIKVDERAKISYVKTIDGYAALDREGTVLELSSEPGEVRPVISGLVIDSAVLGDKCIIENVPDYQRAIIVLGAILQVDNATVENEYSKFANTSEIRILPSGYMFLTIYTPLGSLLQVKLDSTESITDDMTWLRYALVSGGFENLPDGALDMTGDEYIYRPY